MPSDTQQPAPGDYAIQRLTTLSPIRRKRLGSLRRYLAFVEWTPGVGRPLLELSTIHYARWIVLPALPHPDGSDRKWLLNWNYLLFQATYDGPEGEYLNTFGDLLPLRIARLFGTCFGFESRVEHAPGGDDRVFPTYAFRAFVQENRLDERGSYNYRPDAVRTIRQALAIERVEHRSDHSSSASLPRAGSRVEGLALGAPLVEPGWGEALLGPWMRRARPTESVNALTVIAPLRKSAELWEESENPLAVAEPLPCTLFASVSQIPRTMKAQLGQQDPDLLPNDYLVFTSDFYGQPRAYIEALVAQPEIKEIFSRCVGFTGHRKRDSADWIEDHSVKAQYFLCGYPPRPVEELKRLLAQRASIAGDLGIVDRTGADRP